MLIFSKEKFPLSIGIRSAKHTHLILTDADCKPSSNRWLVRMSECFSDNKNVVLGYGKYEMHNTFLNSLIRFETMHTAIQYFSYALAGIPYMGVGRNLAYKKELFYLNNGFSKHYNIPSGDDDLFINSVANAQNTTICLHHEAHTISSPPKTWSTWFKQKLRHVSTGKYYKIKHKLLLSSYHFFNISFWGTFIALCVLSNNLYLILSLFLIKSVLYMYLMYKNTKIFNEKKLFGLSVFYEPLLTMTIGTIYIFKLFLKTTKWK